ncbi:hypothetical protein [Sphingomonas abietis]|uniref:DUF2892 domain-containing protein n=1 Tax=Sphingomonas abietis TaxID=3012344 RepID=A0ABY7NQN8_9SPHN|nr:hypothetical protein [Sphingomonas abietis]WBO23285.1 hypothetical protein PBT88_03875 [Sphingomonas abietis]
MTPDPDKQARDRFAILIGLRAGGAVLMLLGLWMILGGSLGGAYGFGGVLFVVGLVEMMAVPKILARRWRTPR